MISMNQPTGRADDNWDKFGKKESIEKMKKERTDLTTAWNDRIKKTGKTNTTLPVVLEQAGAAGIVMSYWSRWSGSNKIFSARTKKIPTVDLMLEDYGLLYRLTEGRSDSLLSSRFSAESSIFRAASSSASR